MAKRDEFDPNEILDDVTAASEDDFDILGDLPDLSTMEEDGEMDDLFSQDFLSMLGIEPTEEEDAPVSEAVEEVPVEEAPAAAEDEDVKEYTLKPTPAFDVEPELDEEFIKSVEEIFKNAEPESSCASWAVRFAANLDGVLAVLSGMNTVEQMTDNINTLKEALS